MWIFPYFPALLILFSKCASSLAVSRHRFTVFMTPEYALSSFRRSFARLPFQDRPHIPVVAGSLKVRIQRTRRSMS